MKRIAKNPRLRLDLARQKYANQYIRVGKGCGGKGEVEAEVEVGFVADLGSKISCKRKRKEKKISRKTNAKQKRGITHSEQGERGTQWVGKRHRDKTTREKHGKRRHDKNKTRQTTSSQQLLLLAQLQYIYIKTTNIQSCEIEKIVEPHLCKLCSNFRSCV